VCEDNASHKVNEVVTAEGDHQAGLHSTSYDTEKGHFSPADGGKFAEVYHAATNVTREEEVIGLSIRNCYRVKPREVPKVSIRIPDRENALYL
jgi:hypothetical protein